MIWDGEGCKKQRERAPDAPWFLRGPFHVSAWHWLRSRSPPAVPRGQRARCEWLLTARNAWDRVAGFDVEGTEGMQAALFGALLYPGIVRLSFSIKAASLKGERGEEGCHK